MKEKRNGGRALGSKRARIADLDYGSIVTPKTTAATIPNVADSKSLHNYTLSPGWTQEEVDILKIALMKFGIGKWKIIMKQGCLPSKTISQMNL